MNESLPICKRLAAGASVVIHFRPSEPELTEASRTKVDYNRDMIF